ncbi:hypothetical protein FRC08_000121 [Ceratobasidium sp. 394]|nr:hypothetical protein FRC08_000121 [Ceratobasidium sp. 394]
MGLHRVASSVLLQTQLPRPTVAKTAKPTARHARDGQPDAAQVAANAARLTSAAPKEVAVNLTGSLDLVADQTAAFRVSHANKMMCTNRCIFSPICVAYIVGRASLSTSGSLWVNTSRILIIKELNEKDK